MKQDQEQIRALLVETIRLLCKNGLNFKTTLSIQGLVGVTIDEKDVFLIQFDERISETQVCSSIPIANQNQNTFVDTPKFKNPRIKEEIIHKSPLNRNISKNYPKERINRSFACTNDLNNIEENQNISKSNNDNNPSLITSFSSEPINGLENTIQIPYSETVKLPYSVDLINSTNHIKESISNPEYIKIESIESLDGDDDVNFEESKFDQGPENLADSYWSINNSDAGNSGINCKQENVWDSEYSNWTDKGNHVTDKCKESPMKELDMQKKHLHKQASDRKKNYLCQFEDCGATFYYSFHLYRHQREKHGRKYGDTVQPTYQCPACFKKFCRFNSFKNHTFMIHGIVS